METELSGLIFDVSEAKGGESFDTLSDALTYANNVLLPEQKKGGMTIKYVRSSDNKYVQYRYMETVTTADTFVNVSNWQGVDETPTTGSRNLVTSGGVEEELKVINHDIYDLKTSNKVAVEGFVDVTDLPTGVVESSYATLTNPIITLSQTFKVIYYYCASSCKYKYKAKNVTTGVQALLLFITTETPARGVNCYDCIVKEPLIEGEVFVEGGNYLCFVVSTSATSYDDVLSKLEKAVYEYKEVALKEELNVVETNINDIHLGNLVRVRQEVISIDVLNCPYVDNIIATSTQVPSNTFGGSNGYKTYYYKADNGGLVSYKLGSASSDTSYSIVISSEIPALGVQFTDPVLRTSGSEGTINVNEGDYICVIGFPNVPSFFPLSLSIEISVEENVNVVDEIGEKSGISTIESDNLWDSVEEVNSKIQSNESATSNKVPYLIECASYFWMKKQATNFNQNNPFKVSGDADSKTLTILSGGQVSSVLTNDDSLAAIVIKHDDGSCTPHVLVSWTENTLEIYPALIANISSGELVPLYNDAQHLTKLGYHCWVEHLYAANPRYCEKSLYIARYAPTDTYQAPSFNKIGGGLVNYAAAMNDRSDWHQRYGGHGATYYTVQDNLTTSEYGVVWDVNTSGNYRGYLEAMIGTVAEASYMNNYGFDKDDGFEMHIEVYADNEQIYNYVKKTNYVERVCVPFEKGQDNIKLKVYYTKLRAHKESISIDMATLWVNKYTSIPDTLFPKYSILSWFMASWGEFWSDNAVSVESSLNGYPEFPVAADFPDTDQGVNYKEYRQGASGEAMRELISKDSDIQVPIYIRSKAGMTTRFGKAWWPFLVQPYHPNIMVTSFGINDHNTNTNPGQYGDILDPYGNIIDMSTPVTALEYADNIKAMIEMCHTNDITFIHAENSVGTMDWMIALENNLSSGV